ncbi:MAG: hypothetical protein M1840_006362 [Geoglossum simile]|nr:MAG: hypothetical protein M1840_006362 [Geoglossum simile]
MITTTSSFLSSTIAVNQNVVKSILFRCAALLLQVAVYKFFSLLAFKSKAFTSYLMFAEDYIQKGFFIASRGFTRNAILVSCCTVLFASAGLYDALLWGLDAPGYVAHKSNVTASLIENRLLSAPAYIVSFSTKPGETDSLDKDITGVMGASLFEPGVNFTLTGEIDRGHPRVVAPTRPFDPAGDVTVGPRIWLDNEGFSVSPDSYVSSSISPDSSVSSSISPNLGGFYCPWQAAGTNGSYWACQFKNTYAPHFIEASNLGRPQIHWDDSSDLNLQSTYIRPKREDNPWASLGNGASTAVMKQMFTVTKGRERHTFIESAFKASLLMDYETPFPQEEVRDLVKRIWSTDPVEQQSPAVGKITDGITQARRQNTSFTLGWNEGNELSVLQVTFELLNPQIPSANVPYSLLRISSVNITLVRSDTLPQPVKPLEQCNQPFQSEATGGKMYQTDCAVAPLDRNTNHTQFFGQVDVTAVFILNGLLGEIRANTSAKALNQQGFEWIIKNGQKLDNLLLSRGFITTLDPSLVTVEVSRIQPALSYLQITFTILAALLAALSWIALSVFASDHYSSSLLANLYATTSMGGPDTSRKPQYIHKVPEIQLSESGSRTLMETPTGIFRHDAHDDIGVAVADGRSSLSKQAKQVTSEVKC